MSFWTMFKEPRPEDYLTDGDYMEALDSYESAELAALERERDKYYERKYDEEKY